MKRLGLVVKARDDKTSFHWGKEVYSLSGGGGTFNLNKFVEGLLKFDADHSRPPSGCGLGDIEKYSHLLMAKFADILDLSQTAREKYAVSMHGTINYIASFSPTWSLRYSVEPVSLLTHF